MSEAGSAAVASLNGHEDGLLREVRERLATFGASLLSDREVLALVVGAGLPPGCDVHLLAGRLLARFGSVSGIRRAHVGELATVPGLGAIGAGRLAAAFELGRRGLLEEPPTKIAASEDVVEVVKPLLVVLLGGSSV